MRIREKPTEPKKAPTHKPTKFCSPGQGVYKFAFSNTLVSCSLSLLFCRGEELTSSYLEENRAGTSLMPLVQRHMEEIGFCTELVCFIGPHPSQIVKPRSSFLCLCLQHAWGEQARSSHWQHKRMTGSVAKPKAMSVASSLWTSTSCAAGAPAGCSALGSLVQSPWHTVQTHPLGLCLSSGLCTKHCSVWLPADAVCSNRGSPPFLCHKYTALTNPANIMPLHKGLHLHTQRGTLFKCLFHQCVVMCCILQQWRWLVHLSPWILLHPTAHILLFLSLFSPSSATPYFLHFSSFFFFPQKSWCVSCFLFAVQSKHVSHQTLLQPAKTLERP